MTVASVGDVFEGWTGPSIELADERPHGVDCSEDGLRSKQWKEEMGLNVTSEGFATSHEEAVPDDFEYESEKRLRTRTSHPLTVIVPECRVFRDIIEGT